MKTKLLPFLTAALFGGLVNAQFTSGTINLGSTGMTFKLDTTPTIAQITLTGNHTSYLGIGTGTGGMAVGADGFIYNSASTTDYTFNGVGNTPTADSQQDWTIVSNMVSGTTRTIVATRTLAGGPGDIPIPNAAGPLDIFYARGSSTTLEYHNNNRGYAAFTMTAALGVDDVEISKKFLLTENPVRLTLNFQNVEKIESFKIYDIHGRLISENYEMRSEIDASFLKTGVYFMEIAIKENDRPVYQKFIKE